MRNFRISKKRLEISVVCALICAMFISMAHFEAACEDMRQNVLRLHIIANSDSAEDQSLKLKVRDEILSNCSNLFEQNTDLDEAIISAENSIELFEQISNSVIKQNGFDYTAECEIGDSYFETREYDDFTLPAGNYKSLIIKLGKAEGKNWWCVVFPAVCVAAADSSLSDTVGSSATEIAEHSSKYVMRFKIVEIYEDIKKLLKK